MNEKICDALIIGGRLTELYTIYTNIMLENFFL